MRNNTIRLFFLIQLILLSCQDSEQRLKSKEKAVEFSFSVSKEIIVENSRTAEEITSILISITDSDDESVLSMSELSVYEFGNSFITEPIVLSIGNYQLTEFLVRDANDSTVYATPISGSSLASLVDRSLPIAFSVIEDSFTKIDLQVVSLEGSTAQDFGYSSFDFNVINPLSLFVASITRDTLSSDGFSFITSDIALIGDDDTIYSGGIEESFNRIIVDTTHSVAGSSYESYTVEVTKDGYTTYNEVFTKAAFLELVESPLSIVLEVPTEWVQIGQSIFGEGPGDFVFNGDINDEGNIIALNSRPAARGVVKVFENQSGNWVQLGQDVNTVDSNGSAYSLHIGLNGAGNIMVVSFFGAGYTSVIRVYENLGGTWTQIGSDISGISSGDQMGLGTSINQAGNIIALGAPFEDNGGTSNGLVRVYENIGGVWTQLGADLTGDFGDRFGQSVDLSDQGDVVVVGVPRSQDGGNDSGAIEVYEFSNGNWVQDGVSIAGEAANDLFGTRVVINGTGDIVIGSATNGGSGSSVGHIRVFMNVSGVWQQLGQTIEGENSGDQFGISGLDMNSIGSVFAASSSAYDSENGDDSGYIRAFSLEGNSWVQIGENILGEAEDDMLRNPKLNAEGDIMMGAFIFNDNAVGIDAGKIEIYQFQ